MDNNESPLKIIVLKFSSYSHRSGGKMSFISNHVVWTDPDESIYIPSVSIFFIFQSG